MRKYCNKKLAIEKKLINSDNFDLYIKLENFYKYSFGKYLLALVDLGKYDKRIDESNLGIKKIKKKILNIGNLDEFFGFDYMYMINNFFIEKLDLNDIDVLKEFLNGNRNIELLFDVIKRTYKDVLRNNFLDGKYSDEQYNVCYGGSSLDNFARNDVIVLKIYYSVVDDGLNRNQFIERMKQINNFFETLILDLKNEIKDKLDIECDVLLEIGI